MNPSVVRDELYPKVKQLQREAAYVCPIDVCTVVLQYLGVATLQDACARDLGGAYKDLMTQVCCNCHTHIRCCATCVARPTSQMQRG